MRIPMLAIHLQRTLGTDGFKPNPQTHLMPLLATAAKGDAAAAAAAAASGSGDGAAAAATENGNGGAGDGDGSVAGALHFLCCCVVGAAACVCVCARALSARTSPSATAGSKWQTIRNKPTTNNETTKPNQTTAKHHALLMALVAEQLGVHPSAIVDFELNLCDTQPAALGGAAEEFVFAGRLDNLASCWAAVEVCCCCCLLLVLSCCVWAGRGVCVWVVRRVAGGRV